MNEYDLYKYIKMSVLVSIILFIMGLSITVINQTYTVSTNISINDFINQLLLGNPTAIIYLGILNLILIPIVSLFYLDVTYIADRDKNMSLLTIITISMLIIVILIKLLLF